MAMFGLMGLLAAFAGLVVSLVCLFAGSVLRKKNPEGSGATLVWGGHVAVILTFAALTFCCGLLMYCFLTGDTSIEYVVKDQSKATGLLGMLYRVSGLWEGREGSLLFWAWLISLFNTILAVRDMKKTERIDTWALFVSQLVLIGFVGILLFSEENSPFVAMAASYFDENGNLTGSAALWGMNALLEHWAMAVHPPALFIGYAGLTIPFSYAIAALITADSSDAWVRKCQRYAMVSWWFLGIGIGLGAIWAYVVLGWGGYWGWDAVENASLLPWLVGLALIHSFTVYRRRGAFKRWSIMCACLTFAFVITGTFISRSGLVQSVHAFEGDPVSLALFGCLIAASLLAGLIGLGIRWKAFAPKSAADEDVDSFMSRDAAYYFNNVIMVVFALLVCYLTVASALPSWLPFGGRSLSAGTYNAIARPLGVFYCLVLAVCPLLGWSRTNRADFLKRAKVPAIFAALLFAVLLVYLVMYLSPSYDAVIAAGGSNGTGLASEGPAWYYKGLAGFGFAVASLIFFNTLFLIGRNTSKWAEAHDTNVLVAFFKMMRGHMSTYGGYIAHIGIAVMLMGLIGSAMFVTEKTGYVSYDQNTDTAQDFTIQGYTLKYTGNSIVEDDSKTNVYYTVEYDVYRNGDYVGHVAPSLQLVESTQQTKSNAAIVGFGDQDLFIVYKGANSSGAFSMDVRVNPMIRFVWGGFAILMTGVAIAALGRRTSKKVELEEARAADDEEKSSLLKADSPQASRGESKRS
jgi:cytochrome c-type biogenesis protein CcmF